MSGKGAADDEFAGTDIKRCEECGTIAVNMGGHTCESTRYEWMRRKPPRPIRDVLQAHDPRPPDTMVVYSSGKHSRAYHITEMSTGKPQHNKCRPVLRRRDSHWVTATRARAQVKGLHPCTTCHDVDLDAVEAELIEQGLIDP